MEGSPLGPHSASPVELKARLEAARSGSPFLIWRDGDDLQQILELEPERGQVTIGRREGNDVDLGFDPQASRLHAVIERIGGEWTVVDDGLSRNGTFLNGARISGRQRLRDGDVMRFGGTTVAFVGASAHGSRVTDAPEEIPTLAELSPMQREVLNALCRPFAGGDAFATPATNQAIADEVSLSVDAVKTHLRALFQKFGTDHLPQNQKRAQLVARAFASGIVSERELS